MGNEEKDNLDIDINFDEPQPAPAAENPEGDPVLRALEKLPPEIRERAARGIFGGSTPQPEKEPTDRLTELNTKISQVESKMYEAQQAGDAVAASASLAEYIRLQGDLAREQTLREIRPEIEHVRAAANAPVMLQQVKARLANENRFFKFYEKEFEANLRTVLERVPAAALNQQTFEEAALMAEAVAFRKYVVEQDKKRGIPDKDPATGRFVPQGVQAGKKTQAELEREEFRKRVYPELVNAEPEASDKTPKKWYTLGGGN